MKLLTKCTAFMLAALLTGCTEESQNGDGNTRPIPGETDSGARREVLLTLKNKLALVKTPTKADTPIATAEENAISTLDIYVFAAAQENGDYTYQERFAYRADGSDLPEGASALELIPGKDDTQATGLLNLKKGLFVKLYAIANQPQLVDPAHPAQVIADAAFVPLTFTNPGKQGTTIATPGNPTATTFETFHTPLLNADAKEDILNTPLAMSGAYTTPLDLTDFENSARVQVGFKLTRLAARFDIINNAEESRFTIETVSIAKGRRGATFFPIRVYGQTPDAKDEELITYPERSFDGEKANKGTQTGAFYTYPSPLEDNGYIILKGKYQVNLTESKEVSYQVPFTLQDGNGNATALEISNNHRYTIAITKADDYHLDFTLEVADWNDDGSINGYNPDFDNDIKLGVTIPDAFEAESKYDDANKIVSMSLKTGSTFDMSLNTSSTLSVQKTYVGGLEAQQYDWLVVSEPVITKAPTTNYTYTFTLNEEYTGSRYPRAIVRITDQMDGSENILFVDAIAAPQINETKQVSGNPNQLDAKNKSVSMYRAYGSNILIDLTCPDGSTVKSQPEWLNVEVVETKTPVTSYKLTLKDDYRDSVIENDKGSVIFQNSNKEDLVTEITFNLLSAAIFADDKSVTAANSGNINIPVQSPIGVTAEVVSWNSGGGQWFDITTGSLDGSGNIVITQRNNTNTIMKPVTIRLKNKLAGAPEQKDIIITPTFSVPTLSSNSGTDNNYYRNTSNYFTFSITSAGGGANATSSNTNVATVSRSGKTYTVIPKGLGSCTITVPNASNTSLKKTYSVSISGKNYNGKAVWYFNGYYIAPENASNGTGWSSNLTSIYCSNKSGANWRVPSWGDVKALLGVQDKNVSAPQATFNFYWTNNIFDAGSYVTTTETDAIGCFYMQFTSTRAFWEANLKTDSRKVRCVTQ